MMDSEKKTLRILVPFVMVNDVEEAIKKFLEEDGYSESDIDSMLSSGELNCGENVVAKVGVVDIDMNAVDGRDMTAVVHVLKEDHNFVSIEPAMDTESATSATAWEDCDCGETVYMDNRYNIVSPLLRATLATGDRVFVSDPESLAAAVSFAEQCMIILGIDCEFITNDVKENI